METLGRVFAVILFTIVTIADVLLAFWVLAAYGLIGLIVLIVVSSVVLPLLWMVVFLIGAAIAWPFVWLVKMVRGRREGDEI